MSLISFSERFRSARQVFGADLLLGLATMATPVVGFLANFVGARYVDPGQMGLYQTFMLIPAYGGFLHFGVFNGAGRNIPFYHGREDTVKVQAVVDASWRVACTLSAVNATLCALVLVYLGWSGHSALHCWTMACILVGMTTDPLFTHLDCVYRGVRRYASLAKKTLLINSVAGLCSLLPAAAGYGGYLVGRVVQAGCRVPVFYPQVPLKARGPGRWSDIVELARTGFPLLLAGLLYGYLGVADRTLVAVFLGPAQVGQLTLSGLVVASVQFAPVALTTLLYPRIAAHYGQCGTSRGLRRYFWITLGLSVATVIPVCAAAYLLIGPFTRHFLPRYEEGIAAAKVAALGSMGFLYFGVGAIIAVVRRNTLYIAAIVLSLLLVWGLGSVLIAHGWGILGAAWARMAATAFLCLFTVGYAYWLTTQDIRA